MERTKKGNKVELFLDSGAFSAWSQKTTIDINEYIAFIKKHKKLIHVYANLDDINSADKTWKNQKKMEKAGLNPIPVFHYGEPLEWLERYLDEKYQYISLGGMVPISTNKLVQWLDNLFANYLTNKHGMPICKVHGFGLTSLRLMLRYPWYSVDSTSWVIVGRMGAIYIPRKRNGKWVFDEESWKIGVSSRSPTIADKGKHITTMTKSEKDLLLEWVHEHGYKLGKSKFKRVNADYSPDKNERWAEKKSEVKKGKRLLEIIKEEGVSNKYQFRDEMNIIYFVELEKSIQRWPWAFKKKKLQKGFF